MVVDGFGIKYSVKEHALYMKSALEYKYKVITDWEVKLYIGIALKWYYGKCTIQLSIPGYVHAALHSLKHKKTQKTTRFTITLDTTHTWKNKQMLSEKAPAE